MKLIDAHDPRVVAEVGRELARYYWRGFRAGAVVALAGVLVSAVAYVVTR